MAGNFWQSSHFHEWLLERQDLIRERHSDLQVLSEEEYQKLMIFFANFIQVLGEQLKVKQQVISTGIVYFKRFYVRNSLKCIDPLLMAPTCIFLASKVEEFGVISNSRLINICQTVVKNKFAFAFTEFTYRMNHILECEFFLLELMDCCLIIYHPYRPLISYISDIKEMRDLKDNKDSKDELLNTAWSVVNDTFRTDIPLLYPPHLIAIACLHMGCVISAKDFKQWFAELNVDLDKVLEITRHILNLYEIWKNFDEKKEIPALLAKMPKPKTQPPSEIIASVDAYSQDFRVSGDKSNWSNTNHVNHLNDHYVNNYQLSYQPPPRPSISSSSYPHQQHGSSSQSAIQNYQNQG